LAMRDPSRGCGFAIAADAARLAAMAAAELR
jgi:hypothetical protein